jgi:hypothetical protein
LLAGKIVGLNFLLKLFEGLKLRRRNLYLLRRETGEGYIEIYSTFRIDLCVMFGGSNIDVCNG